MPTDDLNDLIEPTERTRLRREPERGSYDRALVHEIIDAAVICHLGLNDDAGRPVVIPTIHARIGDTLYVHGSVASRSLRRLATGIDACCTITHLDGLVVARSGFWSSINYRSVMVFGQARSVDDPTERDLALDALVDHVLPGRTGEVRRPTTEEVRQTKVLALAISEASAKVRTGDPGDDDADLDGPAWAGVVPLRLVAGEPVAAANLGAGRDVPTSVAEVLRRFPPQRS